MASKSSLLLPFLLLSLAESLDISKILSQFDDFSSFNDQLTQTHLTTEINSRQTITVLAVDNTAISAVSGQPADVLKKVLALHVVLDYFDDDKLRQLPNKSVILPTLFQTTGQATGQTGFLNATDMDGGRVGFGSAVPGAGLTANMVKVLVTHPYNISVIQISSVIVPPGIAAGVSNHSSGTPTPSPNPSPAPKAAPTPSATAPATAPAKPPSSGGASTSPSHSPSPSAAKSPPPAAASTPSQAPEPGSPAPSDNSSAGAPAPESDTPMVSPPSPPLPPAASPNAAIDADAPGPAAGGDHRSSAARVVVGAGLAAFVVGVAFLGDLRVV